MSRMPSWEDAALHDARTVLQNAVKLNLAKDRVEHQRALDVQAQCEVRSEQVPGIVALSRTMKSMGTWKSEAGWCPTASLVIDARDVCAEGAPGSQSLSVLSDWWKQQHKGVTKAPAGRAPRSKESLCFRIGMCVCSNSRQGLVTKSFWNAAQKRLKLLPGVTKERLKEAKTVLMWSSRIENIVTLRIMFIAVHYFRPWRPTFLEITAASEEDRDALEAIVKSDRGPFPVPDDVYVTMEVVSEMGQPLLHTATGFIGTLDARRAWQVRWGTLSERQTPFVGRPGRFRVCFSKLSEVITVWSGEPDMKKAIQVRQGSQSHDPCPPSKRMRNQDEDDDTSPDEKEQMLEGTEFQGDDVIGFDADLFDLWEAAAQDAPMKEASETSSSSSSSASSSDESEKAQPKAPAPCPEKRGAEAEKKADQVGTQDGAVTRDRSNRMQFGPHHLVPRFRDGAHTGYQMSCAFHSKCSKEVSATRVGTMAAARVILKSWALLAPAADSRQSHMGPGLRKQLDEASKAGALLTEAELEELVAIQEGRGQEDEAVAPFRVIDAEDRDPDLGGRAEHVPPDIHTAMVSLASRGLIPRTTQQERARNKVSSASVYEVPAELRQALEFGYVHPNIGAPAGLLWRARGGVWRLCPRGG